ncbi:hypothetical protein RB195_022016 [Necator americanus]|uniref:Uncharacterized protein n=1 Tax=Necator americanus TaxID=51031 RepID=A0ABR1EEN7_NECAM
MTDTQYSPLPFKLDLFDAEVSEQERQQLFALFDEFSDRISRDAYDLGSFLSPPPGPSKPWTAASLSHDDTSWASFSEASLAFGSSSQSFYNEDPSSHKRYGRKRGHGAARRLARHEQSPVRDEEFISRPVRIPSD